MFRRKPEPSNGVSEDAPTDKVISDADWEVLLTYQRALSVARDQLRIMELGYSVYSEEVKKKYGVPQSERMVVDPNTKVILTEPMEVTNG